MDDIVGEFLVESQEMLDQLDQDLLSLERDPSDAAVVEPIFRSFHTIKGTCGFLGFANLEELTHAAESLLAGVRDGDVAPSSVVIDALLASLDSIRAALEVIEVTESDSDFAADELVSRMHALRSDVPSEIEGSTSAPDGGAGSSVDEARDQRVGDILVSKGEAERTDVEIAAAEQALGDQRYIGEILVDDHTADRDDVISALGDQSSARQASSSGSIRVDVALLDDLMNLVGELVLTRNQILQLADGQSDSQYSGPSQRLNLITSELQEGVMKTRMQPIETVWRKLPRVVRDLAHQLGKQVRVEMEGKKTELDKTIIEAIKDPLTHIVRNTVDHGIETPDERIAAGKPAEGRLVLSASHEGGQVIIEASDDGGGIDLERVKAISVERGIIGADIASRMTDSEAANLIFVPGFSTADEVTSVSGRGVGTDVVKTNIEKIGGSVDVRTSSGEGTTIRIKIPLTLAIIPALSVTCGGNRYAIPQLSLLELVRLDESSGAGRIEYVHGAPVYRLRGRLLPIVYLRDELGVPRASDEEGRITNIVVLQADDRQFGLVVDQISDTQEIVVKPLNRLIQDISIYSGTTILGDGRVALILDVLGLAQQAKIVAAHGEHDALHDFGEVFSTADSGSSETLLLLGVGDGRRVAMPLSDVARLEEFKVEDIELAGVDEVVQYRGSIMPLVDLGSAIGYGSWHSSESDVINVVVYHHEGRDVGLVVGEILDIVTHQVGEASPSEVIEGRVTDSVDVAEIVSRMLADERYARV